MIALSPDRLVAAATSLVGIREEGHNRGRMVELFLRQVGQQGGAPWCAAFVYHAGYWSHYDHVMRRSSWPLPATASCWELGEFARVRGVRRGEPAPGDVFLVRDVDLRRFSHTGIVVSVDESNVSEAGATYTCTTVEGNGSEAGSREGTMVVLRRRAFSRERGDRFIHWPGLAAAERAA